MMKYFLLLCLLISSLPTWSAQEETEQLDVVGSCSIKGNKDFTIYFDIQGVPNSDQVIELDESGNHASFFVFSTNNVLTAELYDHSLYDGSSTAAYQAAITYDSSDDTLNYYRKPYGSDNWGASLDNSVRDIKSGNLTVSKSSDISEVSCEEEIPEDIPGTPLDDFCPYFPQPLQGWPAENTTSKLTIHPDKTGSFPYYIGGWSDSYIAEHLSGTELAIGFDTFTDSSPSESACEVGNCAIGGEKASTPEDLSIDFPSNTSLTIANYNYTDQCSTDQSNRYCQYEEDGNTVIVTVKDHLNQLTVQGSETTEMIIRFESKSDEGGIQIGDYIVNSNVSTQFNNAGTYSFKTMVFNSDSELVTGSNIVLNIRTSINFHHGMNFLHTGRPDDFVIYAPEATLNFNNNDSAGNTDLYSLILAKKITFNSSLTIYGAVTTNDFVVNSSGSGTTINGQSDCFDSGSDKDYQLTLSPESSYILVCDTEELNFQVTNNGSDDTSFDGYVTVSATNESVLSDASSSGSEITSPVTSGVASVFLEKSNAGSSIVTASLSETSNGSQIGSSVTGSYDFVPFKFDADNQYVAAGETLESVTIKVLACNTTGSETVDNYSTQNIPYTTTLKSPLSGVLGGFELSNHGGDNTPIDFDGGEASVDITYAESGTIIVELLDDDFDCSGIEGCPIDGSDEEDENTGKLRGSFEIYSRPWAFAICEPDDLNISGTANYGEADDFARYTAGVGFSMKVKPVVYTDASTDFCSFDATENFFIDGADVYLKAELHTPSLGRLGTGSSFISKENDGGYLIGEQKSFDAQDGENPWYLYDNLYWNEVGSLTLTADLGREDNGDEKTYLGGVVNGEQNVGRFVPDHMSIIENSDSIWGYAVGHEDFAYMGQENIEHNFMVQAESSQLDDNDEVLVTQNYGLFSPDYISTITYKVTIYAPDSNGARAWKNVESERVSSSIDLEWTGSFWGDEGLLDVNVSEFIFEKNGAILDGPFTSSNANFGLISSRFNAVDFAALDFDADLTAENTGKLFTTQPDFRYGRMVMRDVGGNQGQEITVPLQVEYWDGSQFVVNEDDSGSVINSNQYCTQVIWSELSDDDNVSLGGASSDPEVSEGEFSELYALQSNSAREQIKVWLRQGTSKTSESDAICSNGYIDQPWLQYYWNGVDNDEEDPSATVTFGIYRGNDRVIFRGENRFTGQ